MPTDDERMAWGIGDGHGLRVHQVGEFMVSGLNCWENWVPTIRHVMYAQGTQLHVAAWPGSVALTKDITRFIALEGRCYVLSAGALLTPDAIPEEFPARAASLAGEQSLLYNGGSAIAAPNGRWLVEPVDGEERLVTAEIDLGRVLGERQTSIPPAITSGAMSSTSGSIAAGWDRSPSANNDTAVVIPRVLHRLWRITTM